MNTPSFKNKKGLRFVITLGSGKFGSTNRDVIRLEGFRASAIVDKATTVYGTLRARIFGVSPSDMNSVTTIAYSQTRLNAINYTNENTIEVYAIDGTAQALIFAGNIVNAWGDYQAMPDVCLYIQAQAGFLNLLRPVAPRSFKGAVDVASVMAQIAADMGYAFENNGVNVKLEDVYLPSTNTEQARKIAEDAGIDWGIDDKTLFIVPKGQARGSTVLVVSPASGLVGYPTFDAVGVGFRTLYNPALTFKGRFKLETKIPQARGEWTVAAMQHNLDCETPGGSWFSTVRGGYDGQVVITR